MQPRSIARELALLVLGQIPEDEILDLHKLSLETLIHKALESLMDHWREGLDNCAEELERAQQNLLDSELEDSHKSSIDKVREHLHFCLVEAENVLNGLSASLELPLLLAVSNDKEIQRSALERVSLVIQNRSTIDSRLDSVMEGWRLHRLPRIDRDILRLAAVDLMNLGTPAAVACNEAVDLANRYSDQQGRRMINGILRRLQNACLSKIA